MPYADHPSLVAVNVKFLTRGCEVSKKRKNNSLKMKEVVVGLSLLFMFAVVVAGSGQCH